MQSIEKMEVYLDRLKKSLASFPDKRKQLEWLVEYGKTVQVDESLIDEQYRVEGCISGVYIEGEVKDGKLHFQGTSSSMIVKGYVAILIRAMNDLPRADLERGLALISDFAKETGLNTSVVPSRQNAIANILVHMQNIILSS